MTPSSTPTPSNRLSPAQDRTASARSVRKGDVPDAVLDRYLVERDRQGRPERFFRDHRTTEPMFRDRGRSLSADRAYPDAIADMLKIARHRGWTQVRVAGDDAFRREVWIQAQAMGLDVRGHRPRERDRQAAGQDPVRPAPPNMTERISRAAVVVARLIPDPVVQARLLERAWARADRSRTPERSGRSDHERRR